MTERQPIPKKMRFEVFKRDKFTCQYCGGKSPEVVLQVDHIRPVADGGETEIMNLVTSCAPCNSGKGARLLTDDSVVERQRRQIEDLEERRQQLEMMIAWRDELNALGDQTVDMIADHIAARSNFEPNASGRQSIKRWLKAFSVDEILSAWEASATTYFRYVDDKVTGESWELAFAKIPGVAKVQRSERTNPHAKDLFYIQGILRNRCGPKDLRCVDELERYVRAGIAITDLMRAAKVSDSWSEFDDAVAAMLGRV